MLILDQDRQKHYGKPVRVRHVHRFKSLVQSLENGLKEVRNKPKGAPLARPLGYLTCLIEGLILAATDGLRNLGGAVG